MTDCAVFTIVSKNYLAFARTLMNSIIRLHGDTLDLYVLLADEREDKFNTEHEQYTLIEAKDIAIPDLESLSFRYDIREFNTAVKPFFIDFLFGRHYEKIIYLDPDILVLDKLDLIVDLLERHSIILTPHITSPISAEDRYKPGEIHHLKTGTFNLGFLGLSRTEESLCMVNWWKRKCTSECYHEIESGLFVDQKWMNLISGFFNSVHVLRHAGCNMAYWNVCERKLDGALVNGKEKLVFYHFSGIVVDDINRISKYQNRYTLADRPDLKELFESYREQLICNGYIESIEMPYNYGNYDNGVPIGTVARRLYPYISHKYPHPFMTSGNSYYKWLRSRGILEKEGPGVPGDAQRGAHVEMIHRCLRILCKVLGIDRYHMLMRYLHWISVIRRQEFLLQ